MRKSFNCYSTDRMATVGESHKFRLNPTYKSEQFKDAVQACLAGTHENSKPFPHFELPNFLADSAILADLRRELDSVAWMRKCNDLYSLSQTVDLDNFPAEHYPNLIAFRKFMLAEVHQWLATITGVQLSDKLALTGSLYEAGDCLLPHDDKLEDRAFAFVLYLTPNWEETDGGQLQLYDSDAQKNHPTQVVKSIQPLENVFSLFRVQHNSWHAVAEVLSEHKQRISLNGWYHYPAELALAPTGPDAACEEPLPRTVPTMDITLAEVNDWLNANYVQANKHRQIKRIFANKSELSLRQFLNMEHYNAALNELEQAQFECVGPPNKRRVWRLAESALGEHSVLRSLLRLFRSEAITLLLTQWTGLRLYDLKKPPKRVEAVEQGEKSPIGESSSHAGEEPPEKRARQELVPQKETKPAGPPKKVEIVSHIQRFEKGCYSMADDQLAADTKNNGYCLDVMLFFGRKQNWTAQLGGFTSFFAIGEDEEIMRVVPLMNMCAIVFREPEVLNFTKYLNHRVGDDCFFMLCCSFFGIFSGENESESSLEYEEEEEEGVVMEDDEEGELVEDEEEEEEFGDDEEEGGGQGVMPFGGHIADVAREGIWASLTGGWYYEPAHTLFCNTLHLYIWSLLMIVPLLLGVSGDNERTLSIGAVAAYLALLVALFTAIKLTVCWLHHIFDTVQPIKYKPKRNAPCRGEERESQRHMRSGTGRFSGSSFSATRATESNALDMIEMLEMHQQQQQPFHFRRSIQEQQVDNDDDDDDELSVEELGQGRDMAVRKQQRPLEVDTIVVDGADGEVQASTALNQQQEARDSTNLLALPSASARRTQNGGAAKALSREGAGDDDGEQSSASSGAGSTSSGDGSSRCSAARGLLESERVLRLHTADSLELLPRTSNRIPLSERGQKLARLQQQSSQQHHRRKYSEPPTGLGFAASGHSLGGGSVGRNNWRRGRRRSEEKLKERPFVIRRVNSTAATNEAGGSRGEDISRGGGQRTSLLVPKTGGSLNTPFPGGILVDELELGRAAAVAWRGSERTSLSRKKQQLQRKSVGSEKGKASKEGNKSKAEKITVQVEVEQEDKQQQPCCSSTLEQAAEQTAQPAATTAPPLLLDTLGSAVELAGPSTSSPGTADDLKGQITKFLEELIEKHPETLDAIESVRMNRLFQLGTRRQQRAQRRSAELQATDEVVVGPATSRDEDAASPSAMFPPHPLSQQPAAAELAGVASGGGQRRHLAVDPADTSQGAVHAFQDEHGNWFTYWFGAQSTGTAQPLLSAPAINEMLGRSGAAPAKEAERRPTSSTQHRPLARIAAASKGRNKNSGGGGAAAKAMGAKTGENRTKEARRMTGKSARNGAEEEAKEVSISIESSEKPAQIGWDAEWNSGRRRGHRRTDSSASSSSTSSSSSNHYSSIREEPTAGGVRADIEVAAIGGAQRRGSSSFSSSASSDEANTRRYIAPVPTNVFRAGAMLASGTRDAQGRHPQRPAESGGGSEHHRTHGRQLSESSRHLLALMQRLCQSATAGEPEFAARLAAGTSATQPSSVLPLTSPPVAAPPSMRSTRPRGSAAAESLDGLGSSSQRHSIIASASAAPAGPIAPATPSPGSPSVSTVRLLNDLRSIPPGLHMLYHSARDQFVNCRPTLKYCYHLKLPFLLQWWPFGGVKGAGDAEQQKDGRRLFKLKMDRLHLAALFDRNHSVASCVFDIGLALLVGLLASLVLSRQIYSEMSLLLFAFVVAGAQFSLLKSVQPDSASPVHGFNWVMAYSRPVYFCLLCSVVLLLDWGLPPAEVLRWNWRPPWLHLYSERSFLFAPRDFCATALLFLPVAFTLGLLPQVNTLCMHALEQLDMHLFGATASLSLGSALFSLVRSALCTAALCATARLVLHISPTAATDTIAFSALVAATLSVAYMLSRQSSNPLFVRLLCKAIWRRLSGGGARSVNQLAREREPGRGESKPAAATINESTESALSVRPPTKQLLNCCISAQSSERRQQHSLRKRRQHSLGQEEAEGKHDGQQQQEEEEEHLLLSGGASERTLVLRAQHDVFSALLRALFLFGVHCTFVFQAGQPHLERVLAIVCIVVGLANHHVYPQLRAKHPWKLFAQPILRPHEFRQFEATLQARLTAFERVHAWMLSLEKNILYPLLCASLMSSSGIHWHSAPWHAPVLVLCALRLARTGYAQPQQLYIPLLATCLIHSAKFGFTETDRNSALFWTSPLLCLFLSAIAWSKLVELLLKLHFILCYIAPWQISWGSAFHAFAQPFSVPHSGLTLAQAVLSSVLSAPLNPFLGSSFFLMSYVRPVKFWERDYNTTRVDHSKLRLASQLERGPMQDVSNLNAIFYEHLTRSLQKSLAGDLLLGRWACSVRQGDCFILASNYLNCMVQLVELGNGFVTFQLRGLEFRGTYCHQREMEAISEDWADANGACCCCMVGRLPSLISFNNAWALRWLAWEVTVAKYVVDGYSISDNSAVNMLQVHELRRLLVTLYVKSMIFYALSSPQLERWLGDETVLKALEPIRRNARYVDPDPVFCAANDEDYDLNMGGLSLQSFVFFYAAWIEHCLLSRSAPLDPLMHGQNGARQRLQLVNAFAFALSMLGRRALGTAAYNRHANAAESFLFGMHALFKGDMRIMHPADEWVFTDPEILAHVISPAVRMALKLHQDHFAAVVDLDEPAELYTRISHYQERIFISHEHDPAWRRAILANTPSLLALRHICDDGQDDYKVIMLNKRHLDMRVIKLNRECVRAFWAGQQQELIFLRNKNPERGSIQNARQVLRNMINSSADQPIGYPIYVSPLTTSFVETHPQLEQVLGPPLTLHWCWAALCALFARLRAHFGPSSSSSAAAAQQQQQQQSIPMSTLSSAASAPPPVPSHQSELLGGGIRRASRATAAASTAVAVEETPLQEVSSIATTTAKFESAAAELHKTLKDARECAAAPSSSSSSISSCVSSVGHKKQRGVGGTRRVPELDSVSERREPGRRRERCGGTSGTGPQQQHSLSASLLCTTGSERAGNSSGARRSSAAAVLGKGGAEVRQKEEKEKVHLMRRTVDDKPSKSEMDAS